MGLFALFVLTAPLREDFAKDWNSVASSIRNGYYAREKRKGEMEQILTRYSPLARAAKSQDEFGAVLDRMVAEFHDSHFDFLTNKAQGYYLMDGIMSGERAETMPQMGAWFKPADDGYTVQMLLNDGAAEKAGLQRGDVLLSVDGKPFSPVESLKTWAGKSAPIRYRRGTEVREATVPVVSSGALKMFLDATLSSGRTLERNGKHVGYLHLWTQVNKDFEKALTDALAKAKDADGFVLDLRAGFGGHVQGFDTALAKANYSKPLVVIIDRGSRSAKEILSYQLQQSHRATLVGETTAGNVLGAVPIRINDWSYLEVPVIDFDFKGVRLEGRGVAPDVAVADQPGKDLPLDRAVDLLTAPRL